MTTIAGNAHPEHPRAEFALYLRYDRVVYICRNCLHALKVKNLVSQQASELSIVNPRVLESEPLVPAVVLQPAVETRQPMATKLWAKVKTVEHRLLTRAGVLLFLVALFVVCASAQPYVAFHYPNDSVQYNGRDIFILAEFGRVAQWSVALDDTLVYHWPTGMSYMREQTLLTFPSAAGTLAFVIMRSTAGWHRVMLFGRDSAGVNNYVQAHVDVIGLPDMPYCKWDSVSYTRIVKTFPYNKVVIPRGAQIISQTYSTYTRNVTVTFYQPNLMAP